jgi:hypothetical protein
LLREQLRKNQITNEKNKMLIRMIILRSKEVLMVLVVIEDYREDYRIGGGLLHFWMMLMINSSKS